MNLLIEWETWLKFEFHCKVKACEKIGRERGSQDFDSRRQSGLIDFWSRLIKVQSVVIILSIRAILQRVRNSCPMPKYLYIFYSSCVIFAKKKIAQIP